MGVIADHIYEHLDQQKLLPEEQKGCRKRCRGTNDLLYIGRPVIRIVKSRKKAYDMVPHFCIKECLDLFGVAENFKTFLVNSMENVENNVEYREFRVRRS